MSIVSSCLELEYDEGTGMTIGFDHMEVTVIIVSGQKVELSTSL